MPTIKTYGQLQYPSSGLKIGKANHEITLTGAHVDHRIVAIGTTEETITIITDIVNAGLIYIENLDATNYVQLGWATAVYVARLKPLEPNGPWRLEPTISQFFLKADTAECDVEFYITED